MIFGEHDGWKTIANRVLVGSDFVEFVEFVYHHCQFRLCDDLRVVNCELQYILYTPLLVSSLLRSVPNLSLPDRKHMLVWVLGTSYIKR
jgi:hypothetical protein